MSDASTLRKPAIGTGGDAGDDESARVWQVMDLLKLNDADGGFKRTAWSESLASDIDAGAAKPLQPATKPKGFAKTKVTRLSLNAPDALGADELEADLELEPEIDAQAQAEQEAANVSAQALKDAQDASYAEGLAEGERRVREAWDADKESRQAGAHALLQSLDQAVRSVIQSPEQIHEPLKRLALHLAEQLVLAELSLAPQAIERLVRRAVDELSAPRQAPVLVELHPDDLAMLKTGPALADAQAEDRPWQLQANDSLLPGSVKVSANDGMLVDLIENRLEALAQGLLLQPGRGTAQSAFTPSRMAQRQAAEQPVIDAQVRESSSDA